MSHEGWWASSSSKTILFQPQRIFAATLKVAMCLSFDDLCAQSPFPSSSMLASVRRMTQEFRTLVFAFLCCVLCACLLDRSRRSDRKMSESALPPRPRSEGRTHTLGAILLCICRDKTLLFFNREKRLPLLPKVKSERFFSSRLSLIERG